jgi:hypothetical protein
MLTVEIDFRMAGLDDEIPVKKKKKNQNGANTLADGRLRYLIQYSILIEIKNRERVFRLQGSLLSMPLCQLGPRFWA